MRFEKLFRVKIRVSAWGKNRAVETLFAFPPAKADLIAALHAAQVYQGEQSKAAFESGDRIDSECMDEEINDLGQCLELLKYAAEDVLVAPYPDKVITVAGTVVGTVIIQSDGSEQVAINDEPRNKRRCGSDADYKP